VARISASVIRRQDVPPADDGGKAGETNPPYDAASQYYAAAFAQPRLSEAIASSIVCTSPKME
jgi:hypothetical protein